LSFNHGKLVGKFEEMYQHSSETPWHQDKTAYAVQAVVAMRFTFSTSHELPLHQVVHETLFKFT